MTDHAKIGRRSRQKGAQGERDVANELRVIYPDAARGGLLQTQYGRGSNACDVGSEDNPGETGASRNDDQARSANQRKCIAAEQATMVIHAHERRNADK